MKENKAIYVTKDDIREDRRSRQYQLYTSKITRDRYEPYRKEAGIQCNYKRDVICTCRNISGLKRRDQEVRYFSGLPKPIYAYHGSQSFTDIGVGGVKAYQKKNIKRVYLPDTDDRGVGSSGLSSFISRRHRYYKNSYYDDKKTSSKCVGGVIEGNAERLNEKLSPMIHTKSITTSPSFSFLEEIKNNVEIGCSTHEKKLVTTSTEVKDGDLQKEEPIKDIKGVEVTAEQVQDISKTSAKDKKSKEGPASYVQGRKHISKRAQEAERVFSSDSLVQHVHNLENPSEDDPSGPMSVDPMENKLEREYRKMFCPKSKEQKSSEEKPDADMKSTSVLRRRFEALRRSLAKKEDSKKNAVLATNKSSNVSAQSHRDVSIASDPPSLEARSYSNSKMFHLYPPIVPDKSNSRTLCKKSFTGRKYEEDNEGQGVKGMFKLWGRKFNLEDEECAPGPSADISKKSKDFKMPATESESKKEGKKFFFFKKKSKDKTPKPTYKQKKGVTAGRCEVGDGLMIRIGAANTGPSEEKYVKSKERIERERRPEEYEGILRKAWLQQFLTQTIESGHSVKIRWNNKAYATSSSTVFEMMENVYKDTGVVFRSRSEITTGESSFYKSFTKQRVNFVQDIEAWMIPEFIPDKPRQMPVKISSFEKCTKNDNIEVRTSNNKWFIDKSKAFAHKIEVVLHSKNVVKPCKNPSSEYLRIDIPKGFFSDSNSDSTGQMNQTSNEEVYKIVEYESPELFVKNRDFNIGDHLPEDIKVTVSVRDSCDLESKIIETVIKRPPHHRDVAIQNSNVYIPKRCNVIGVGIITQKDVNRIRKPILKIQDDYSDEDSDQTVHHFENKSKFADSYLQEYYRHWTPLGIDFFSWCVSDTHLQCCSENSHITVNQQGDGSKSCPNIYEDYQASTHISSCGSSCCITCGEWEEPNKDDEEKENKLSSFFSKFKAKSKSEPTNDCQDKRVCPKDSLEVFKRRKVYSASKKCYVCDSPYSIPSTESKSAQNMLGDGSKARKPCNKQVQKRSACKKHVSLPSCDNCESKLPPDPTDLVSPTTGILSFKGTSKCNECNNGKNSGCAKHAKMVPPPLPKCPTPPSKCPTPPTKCPTPPPKCPTPPSKCPTPPPKCPSPPPKCPTPPSPCPPSPKALPPCKQKTSQSKLKMVTKKPSCCGCMKKKSPSSLPAQKPSSRPCTPPKGCCSPGTSPNRPPPCPPKPKPTKCNTPPCKPESKPTPKCDFCQKCPSQEFPWPLKNQNSNQPSVSSICSSPPSSKGSCKKKCSSLPSKTKPCPETKPRNPPCDTPPIKTGIFLKMNPIKKTCSKECLAWQVQEGNRRCSEDDIIINIKQGTASTEEIREGMHIKVKGEDGMTLYERRDYQKRRPSVLNNMYQTNVHKVSTSIVQNMAVDSKKSDTEQGVVQDTKSEASVANVIEINFKLKVTQGDKTTEINVGNDNIAPEKPKLDTKNLQTSQVFYLKDEAEQCTATEEVSDKNDINIKIIIKNYKPKKLDEHNEYLADEEFNQKISGKFQTVSTGYSDIVQTHDMENVENTEKDNDEDKVYSVHRATIDLTSSNEMSKTNIKKSYEAVSGDEYIKGELEDNMISSCSATEKSGTEQSEGKLEDVSRKKDSDHDNLPSHYKDTNYEKAGNFYSMTDLEDQGLVGCLNNTSDEPTKDANSTDLIPSSLSKEEKMRLLKLVFEKTYKTKKTKGKDRMKHLRDMLKTILTSDSSDHDDMAVTNNELIKEMTYASLKPNYFQDTDSMNNYYNSSVISSAKDVQPNVRYPTMNGSECSAKESDVPSSNDTEKSKQGCLCTTLAARLNMCEINEISGVCYCRKLTSKKTDEETCCDLRTEEDLFLLNYKTIDYINVETHTSKFVCNSTNLSVHSKAISGSIRNSVDFKAARDSKNLENDDVKNTKKIKATFSPHTTHIRPCEKKRLNRNTMLGISDEDKVYFLNAKPTKVSIDKELTKRNKSKKDIGSRKKKTKFDRPADILQCYETKKAVLEIYAEKTVSNEEERLVAKLPREVNLKGMTRNLRKILAEA